MTDDESASTEDDASEPQAGPESDAPDPQAGTESGAPDPSDHTAEGAEALDVAIQALRGASFSGKLRGYARADVDLFLERVAGALETAREQAHHEAREVREITDFARHAMEAEVERGREEAARLIAEAEERRQEAEAERDAMAADREHLAADRDQLAADQQKLIDDNQRAQQELKGELERTRFATTAAEQGRDAVASERQRLEETRMALEAERQELAALREEARAAESRAHELRRKLLAETERAIAQRWAELGEHVTNVGKQQAQRLLELVSDFIAQLDPVLVTGAIPPPASSSANQPSHLSAIPYRDPERS